MGVIITLLQCGCVWRTSTSEHYIGPVLFRYAASSAYEAVVWQHRHFPLVVEAGRQWGMSLWWFDRIAAFPKDLDEPEHQRVPTSWRRWWLPFSSGEEISQGEWAWSPFYLRGDSLPIPEFVCRTHLGLVIEMGAEARSAGFGFSQSTQLIPHDHAFYVFRFDKTRPMNTRFVVTMAQELALQGMVREVRE